MTGSVRFPLSVYRLPAIVFLVFVGHLAAQPSPKPAPPVAAPMTRAAFRSHWFELQNALLEGDVPAARTALASLTRAARAMDVRRLADYSRMAVHEARKAERASRLGSAWLGYEAAVTLDDSSFDAAASRAGFLLRTGRLREALSRIPETLATLARSAESRLSLSSSAAIAAALALATATLAFSIALFLRYFRRIAHDLKETGGRPFGHRAAGPLAFVLLALPIYFTLGPIWLVLYWAVLAYAYSERRERLALASLLLALGFVPLLVDLVARENLRRRSALHLAAVDLAEGRDDASVEDALTASAVTDPDDPEVWFLLARYAERAGDRARALVAYGRAIEADPEDYRAYVNRGNVRFADGEYSDAISDYEEATRRAPNAAEAFYNLSVARSEIYDFKGQERARARALAISRRDVDAWSSHPPLARVVPAAHRISRPAGRGGPERKEASERERPAGPVPETLLTPGSLGPWGALAVAVVLAALRSRRGVALECSRCGRAFCRRCKRYGGPALYCGRCVRITRGGEEVEEEAREQDRIETEARARSRRWTVRAASFLIPGIHRVFAGRPWAGAATMLVFFLAIALAVGGPWSFAVRPLAPSEAALPARLAAVFVALALWLPSLAGAWRQTREP